VKKVAILVPARLSSKRLPRKLLYELYGLPVLEHVRRRCLMNESDAEVIICTGDQEIADEVEKFNGIVFRNSVNHESGTSRCSEAAKVLDFDRYLIVQGDEVLVHPKDLDLMIKQLSETSEDTIIHAISNDLTDAEIADSSIVKCYLDRRNQILMMFRKAPTGTKHPKFANIFRKSLGLYGFNRKTLADLSGVLQSNFGEMESIEQMNWIDHGLTVRGFELESGLPSINTPKDLAIVKKILSTDNHQKKILRKLQSV
jgi:3-deoxy-manno-octulosonate cytidylyltransferase (CMP-KDO synthetase)